MIIHENRLLADDSHEISYLILFETRKDGTQFVICCSGDWCFRGKKISRCQKRMQNYIVGKEITLKAPRKKCI